MSFIDQGRDFVKDVMAETKRVSWPTRDELKESTMVVIVSVFVVSVVVGMIDLAFTHILRTIIKGT